MPRTVIVSTLALTALAAALGFWLGNRWQPMDETAVISNVAAAHVAAHGGRPSDCVAVPGIGDVWLRVTCAGVSYLLNARGVVVATEGPGA